MSADQFVFPREMIDAALDRVIAPMISPERIEMLAARLLESRIGTLTLEDAARRYDWEVLSFRRLLKKNGINVIYLSRKKPPLVSTADLVRLMEDHKRPVGKPPRRRRKAEQPAAIAA